MNWNKAKQLLLENIKVGNKIDPNSKIRKVTRIPINETGSFSIKIGTNGNTILVSMEMLESIFNKTLENKNIYEKKVIYELYKKEVDGHSCYVHSVGHLFRYARVMKKNKSREFEIIDIKE
jgi:hypothetical protein